MKICKNIKIEIKIDNKNKKLCDEDCKYIKKMILDYYNYSYDGYGNYTIYPEYGCSLFVNELASFDSTKFERCNKCRKEFGE